VYDGGGLDFYDPTRALGSQWYGDINGLYDYDLVFVLNYSTPNAVLDTASDWAFAENSTWTYLESQTITINGTLRQSIGWQNAAIFVDASGNGQNATPSFRTTSSNADVSASLVDFQTDHEAALYSWDLYAYTNPVGDIPSQPGGMYEGVNPSFPGHSIPDEISVAGGIPTGLFWFLIPCLLVVLVGLLIHDKTKSLVAQIIVIGLCILFLSLLHIWSFWVIIPFAIMSLAFCLAGKVYGY
jgi:hypothetical protein